MKSASRLFSILPIMMLAALSSGCSSYQWQEAGKNFGTAAAEQLFVLAIGGMDGLEEYNDRRIEEERRENNPYRSSLTREQLIEAQKSAEQWERYDDLLMKQHEAMKQALPGGSAADRSVCPDPGLYSGIVCY